MSIDAGFRPKKLVVSVGGFTGPAFKIEYLGKDVIAFQSNQHQNLFPPGTDFTAIEVSDADWRAFRAKIDQENVWNWKAEYDNFDILDGTQWEVSIKYVDRSVNSSGSNAYPKNFDEFLHAIGQLLGGVDFDDCLD